MKRIFNALGLMLVSALTLTNCTKNIETPVVESEGVPFEIVASTVETKTVNDGMSTLWKTGDQINLFHAVAGTTTYSNDKNFTVNNVETGLFKGTLTGTLAEDSAYDWYAFYPYASQMTTPANTTAYAYVGNRNGLTQNGYDNMAHLSGTNCPLYGVAKAVPAGEMPSLQMQHLTSVIAVKVTNTLETPLKVNEVVFTADGNELTGSFYINIAGDEVTYKSSTGYVSTEAKVTVSNATELEKGESATVYLVVKPFEAYDGDMLEIFVNGYRKELFLEKDVDFVAGKIKTLNFAYDSTEEPEGPEELTVAEFLEKSVSSAVWYQLTGRVSNIADTSYGNFDLVDETGTVYVYGLTQTKVASNDKSFSKIGLKAGDVLTLMGTRAAYNSVAQVGGPAYYVSHIPAADVPVIDCKDNLVTITAEEGATIYYTIDGEDPTTESTVYSEPIELVEGDDFTVKAIAAVEGKATSLVASRPCKWLDPNASVGTPSTVACYTLSSATQQGSNNSYAGNCDITQGGIKWNINGNTQINPWRIGGKSITKVDRTVYSKTAYADPLSKVEFVSGTMNVTSWNSLTLIYSTSSDFSNSQSIVLSGSSIGASKTISFAPEGGFPAGCYFKFVLNVTVSGTSNKYIQLKEIKFYGYDK